MARLSQPLSCSRIRIPDCAVLIGAIKVAQDLLRQNLLRTHSLPNSGVVLRFGELVSSQARRSALERSSDSSPVCVSRQIGPALSVAVAPIAALPRPFRRTPGRLSRGYHSQEEGLEIDLREYRPTIFVLRRGRWGTGGFRRQPFSDLGGFLAKGSANAVIL